MGCRYSTVFFQRTRPWFPASACIFGSRGSNTFFWPPRVLVCMWSTKMLAKYSFQDKNFNSDKKLSPSWVWQHTPVKLAQEVRNKYCQSSRPAQSTQQVLSQPELQNKTAIKKQNKTKKLTSLPGNSAMKIIP